MTGSSSPPAGLRRSDYLLILAIGVALYGWGAFSGRPLSIHEARLPQLAREMVQGKSDWLLPQSGGRPWLERPPLPHWFMAGSMLLFGRTDSLWVARLPGALMGTVLVMLGAWVAAGFFGRHVGLLSAIVLATTYEIYTYATLAEDDIFLGVVAVACMALFVKAEQVEPGRSRWPKSIFTGRPWPVLLMFTMLGLTNLAKGPLVGAAPIIGALGVYLLWNRDWPRLRRYLWLWGAVIFIALTIAWPLLALRRYPDVLDNWRYDYTGYTGNVRNTQYNNPIWYYALMFPMATAPWLWAAISGLVVTARRAFGQRNSAERLLWCWAWMGLLVLSLPARKHHHYLVPVLAPWAILSAVGLLPVGRFLLAGRGPRWMRNPWVGLLAAGAPVAVTLVVLQRRIPGPAWATYLVAGVWILCVGILQQGLDRRSARLVLGAYLVGHIAAAGWIQSVLMSRSASTMGDMNFLADVRAAVPAEEPLLINARTGTLEFFRLQFYLPSDARLVHNLSFLRDRNITAPAVHVIARGRDRPELEKLGQVQIVLQSARSHDEQSPEDRFTLFRLTFRPDLQRWAVPPVGVMQAMERKTGPWCGDPL